MFKEKLHPVLDMRENIRMIDEDKAEVPGDFYALVFIDKIVSGVPELEDGDRQ